MYFQVPDTEEFDWVRDYPAGASVTELEMYSAALADPERSRSKAFFYLRDSSFISDVKKKWVKDFTAEDEHAEERLVWYCYGIQCSLPSKMNVRQTVSLHLKRRDNCEKM